VTVSSAIPAGFFALVNLKNLGIFFREFHASKMQKSPVSWGGNLIPYKIAHKIRQSFVITH
jgi:hypothetical protein